MADNFTVELDVGGKMFKTTIDTLKESEFLYNLAGGYWLEGSSETQRPIFIDRDGYLFGYILLYLRTGNFNIEDHHLKNLKREADFYLLPNISVKIDSMIEATKPKECIYELVTEDEFKAVSSISISDLTIGNPAYRRAIGVNKHFITSLVCRTSAYNCPRGIFSHNSPSNCGRKCNNAKGSYHEEYITTESTMYLICTTNYKK